MYAIPLIFYSISVGFLLIELSAFLRNFFLCWDLLTLSKRYHIPLAESRDHDKLINLSLVGINYLPRVGFEPPEPSQASYDTLRVECALFWVRVKLEKDFCWNIFLLFSSFKRTHFISSPQRKAIFLNCSSKDWTI